MPRMLPFIADPVEIQLIEKTYTGADCLAFPFVVPGYGEIVNHSAWQVFLSDYQFRCEALERVTRYCQMQELEKEMEE